MNRSALITMAGSLFLFMHDAPALSPPLPFSESLEVTKSQWFRDEDVIFRHSICNVSGDSVELTCARCDVFPAIEILASNGSVVAFYSGGVCPAVCIPDTWQPGECRFNSIQWSQSTGDISDPNGGAAVPPGTYHAETTFNDPTLQTGPFQILAAPAPIPMLGSLTLMLLSFVLGIVGVLRLSLTLRHARNSVE